MKIIFIITAIKLGSKRGKGNFMKSRRIFNAVITSTLIISSFLSTLHPALPTYQGMAGESAGFISSRTCHYKALVFDLFGVLVRIDKAQADHDGKKICPLFDSETVMSNPLWAQGEFDQSVTADVIASNDALLETLDSSGKCWADLSSAIFNFVENIHQYIQPIPAGIALFQLLKAQNHCKIFILSNLATFCLTERSCLYDIFAASDGVILSCRVGHRKPDREIYIDYLDLAETKFGISREEGNHLFFDDRSRNLFWWDEHLEVLKGAAAVNINGILWKTPSMAYLTLLFLGILHRDRSIEPLLESGGSLSDIPSSPTSSPKDASFVPLSSLVGEYSKHHDSDLARYSEYLDEMLEHMDHGRLLRQLSLIAKEPVAYLPAPIRPLTPPADM